MLTQQSFLSSTTTVIVMRQEVLNTDVQPLTLIARNSSPRITPSLVLMHQTPGRLSFQEKFKSIYDMLEQRHRAYYLLNSEILSGF